MNRNKIITVVLVVCFCFLSMKSDEYIKSLCKNDLSLMTDTIPLSDLDSLAQLYTVENVKIDSVQFIDKLSSLKKDSLSSKQILDL